MCVEWCVWWSHPVDFGRKMRATRAVMGGGRRFFHPRYIWSPAGGYWNEGAPGSEKRSWILPVAWVLAVSAVLSVGAKNDVRNRLQASLSIPHTLINNGPRTFHIHGRAVPRIDAPPHSLFLLVVVEGGLWTLFT